MSEADHPEGLSSGRLLPLVHDLTTWPEVPYNWEPGKRYLRNSFNHPMHSGFAAVCHESLGGIRPDQANPGFKRSFLKPCLLPDLDWVKVTHRSPQGMISSSWKRDGGSRTWKVIVPPGSAALVQLPQFPAAQMLESYSSIRVTV